jgi:hypothetical protein
MGHAEHLNLPEDFSRLILQTAIVEERCAEMLSCLFQGGSVTVGPDGKLMLVSKEILDKMFE